MMAGVLQNQPVVAAERKGRVRALPRAISLRTRLFVGAALIACLCIGAAVLGAWGAFEMRNRVDAAAAAQARLEVLGTLSARVNDYALVAIEASGSPAAERLARLSSRAEVVRDSFAQAGAGLAAAVDDARLMAETEQMARASRSIGLARMEAEFEALDRRLSDQGFQAEALRAELDTFATRFSPLLDRQITEERRAREAAYESVHMLSSRMTQWALALSVAAVLALALFHAGLVRPLIGRLSQVTHAARQIGSGTTGVRLSRGRRDELGLAASQLNRMAARLDRRADRVRHDRHRLEQTIAERTEALQAANARLEQIDNSRRRFFADIGHELRTPLTVIRAEAELGAAEGAPDPQTTRQSFRTILARAAGLNRRVDDLLRVARSESGEIALAGAPFDPLSAMREAAEHMAGQARRNRITLDLPEGPGAEAMGDADWTRQVIAGLIDNAIRHSPEGSRIRLELDAGGDTLTIAVTDEGTGITRPDQARLFERFERGSAIGDGFGIGLALARWVVEAQGGAIGVTSPAPPLSDPARGPGSRFHFTLPRVDAR